MTTRVGHAEAVFNDPMFRRSIDHLQIARELIPHGVSSAPRACQHPLPLCIDHGIGSRIVDADGNEYLDYVGAGGPLLLGHCPPPVVDALRAQLDRGFTFAMQHEGETELARRVIGLVPSVDMVTFYSSGSEAVHAAIATARGITRRPLILKFEGHYHGWIGPINVNLPGSEPTGGTPPYPIDPSPGWLDAGDVIAMPWNDSEALRAVLEAHVGQVAAVIMEPIAINAGCLRPLPGYLEQVRELCTDHEVLLIFDEIITGFRVALGGAQQLFGVSPDITVMAKAIASGFPLSAVGGSRSVMERAIEAGVPFRGTYNGNPLATAAAIATLDHLTENERDVYPRLERFASTLASGIRQIARRVDVPIVANRVGSAIALLWGAPDPTTTYAEVSTSDLAAIGRLETNLLRHGVMILPDGRLYLSSAHTQKDVDATLAVFEEALAEV